MSGWVVLFICDVMCDGYGVFLVDFGVGGFILFIVDFVCEFFEVQIFVIGVEDLYLWVYSLNEFLYLDIFCYVVVIEVFMFVWMNGMNF